MISKVKVFLKRIVPFILLVVAILLLGLHSLIYPFGRDQGIYAYGGWRMLYGEVPYKDFWDFKPPLIYPIYSVAIAVFGHNLWGIRALDLIFQLITALLCGWLALLLFERRLAFFIASLIYAFSYFAQGYWQTAQSDGFATLFVLASLTVALKWNKKVLSFFVSGLFLGLAFWLKYSLILFGLPIIMTIWLKRDSGAVPTKGIPLTRGLNPLLLKLSVACALGVAVAIIAGFLYFWLKGAWSNFLLTEFELAKRYSALLPFHLKVRYALNEFSAFHFPELSGPLLWTLVVIGFLFASKKEAIFNIILALVSSLHVVIQGKFFPYHFWPVFGVMSPIAAFGLIELWRFLWDKRRIGVVVASLLILFLAYRPMKEHINYNIQLAKVLLGKKTLVENYFEQDGEWGGDFCFEASWQAAQFLKSSLKPTDSFYIWGFEPIIYYLAEKKCPNRFIYNVPLYGTVSVDSFRDELLLALEANPPKYIIVVSNDSMGHVRGVPEDSVQGLLQFPKLKEFIEENYYKTVSLEDFTFYKLMNIISPPYPPSE